MRIWEVQCAICVPLKNRLHGVSIVNASGQTADGGVVIDADNESLSHVHLQRVDEAIDVGVAPSDCGDPDQLSVILAVGPNGEDSLAFLGGALDFPFLPC